MNFIYFLRNKKKKYNIEFHPDLDETQYLIGM